jgi:P-type Ca2+ transporter type 2C
MDGPPAQSLGVEPVDPAIMSRPPRAKNARVLTKALIKRVLQSAVVITLGTLIIYIHEMSDGGVVTRRDTTMTFTCFVLFDMFNALSCRSAEKSLLRGEMGLWDNRMFSFAVSGSLLGQAAVVYVPFLQAIFQTEALGLFDWIRLILVTSTVFWVDEIRKWSLKRKNSRLGRGYSGNV